MHLLCIMTGEHIVKNRHLPFIKRKLLLAAFNKIMKESTINIKVRLDEKNIPEKIDWNASDAPPDMRSEANAMLLAFWDAKQRNGISLDLWTKEMTVEEMNHFFFQTLMSLSETLQRATQNQKASVEMKEFARKFFETVQIDKTLPGNQPL